MFISLSDNPKRKLKYTWELSYADSQWVGVNTGFPNRLVREGIENGTITDLQGYYLMRGEVPYGEHSRIDLFLEGSRGLCFVEVKNVTLVLEKSFTY